MARAEARTVVSVEVLEERDVVPPPGIGLQHVHLAMARAAPVGSAQEQRDEAAAQILGTVTGVEHLTAPGGVLDADGVAHGAGVALQAAQHDVVDGHPDRAAPVGVAPEHPRRGLSGLVVDGHVRALQIQRHRILQVVTRQRTQAVR